ncbi:MAG: glycine cleavage system aminomethyltransferase GcvT [Planctomycetes bacterium]|nr:glycine cleavage system aminomethyltransferase GcvT [Planctomycetota bacterium]
MQAFDFMTEETTAVGSVLYSEHLKRVAAARLASFAGYLMPLWFSSIKAEHRAVREKAGLFDCTHMGVLEISGPEALGFLQTVTTNDASTLTSGKAQYSYILDADGGVLDDIIVYRRAHELYLLVINAGNESKIKAYFSGLLEDDYCLEPNNPHRLLEFRPQIRDLHNLEGPESRVDIALQGPMSMDILSRLVNGDSGQLRSLESFEFCETQVSDIPCLVARTGYTGAKCSFELLVSRDRAADIWRLLLSEGESLGLAPCGLGARDSLRIEAGLPLYGHELAGEYDISPLEAGYGWAVKLDKPFFVGKAAMKQVQERQSTQVVRISCTGGRGLRPVRQGDAVINHKQACVGWVLSSAAAGDRQIALALVDRDVAQENTTLGIYYLARHPGQASKGRLERVERGQTVASDLSGLVVQRFARF